MMSGVPHFELALRSPSGEPIRAAIPGAQVRTPALQSSAKHCKALESTPKRR
jgi:hypothetical protein